MRDKLWGSEPFWGLGSEWDPDWVLTDRQQELRDTLIELCAKELRANAKRSDDELLFLGATSSCSASTGSSA